MEKKGKHLKIAENMKDRKLSAARVACPHLPDFVFNRRVPARSVSLLKKSINNRARCFRTVTQGLHRVVVGLHLGGWHA